MSASNLMRCVSRRASDIGLGLEDLATLSLVSMDRLGALRKGDPVTASEFEQLCRAVAVDPGAMYRGEESKPTRTTARFRRAFSVKTTSPRDVRLMAMAAEQGRILGDLMRGLDREALLERYRRHRPPSREKAPWKAGYELGEAARSHLCPGGGPLVDLEKTFNNLGIHVAWVRFETPGIDAASVWEPGAVPVVLLNAAGHPSVTIGARRSALAHELCHLLYDGGRRSLTTRVSWEEETGNDAEAEEQRARAFAPAFLAPRAFIRDWVKTLDADVSTDPKSLVTALARAWGFSDEGAAWHAKNCGLLSPEDAERLARQSRNPRVHLEDFERGPPAGTSLWSGLADRIVTDAVAAGWITEGRARELRTWE